MDTRLWRVIAIVLGGLFLVSLILVTLFGVRLSQNNQIKNKEAAENLSSQEQKLKEDFQKEKEQTDFTYTAADIFGGFQFTYPKVWSTNIAQEEGAGEELIFLADPNLIVNDKKTNLITAALRLVVYSDKYEAKLAEVEDSNKDTKLLTESNIKVSGITGKKFIGKNDETKQNVGFALVPLRDKALYIGTDNYAKFKTQFEKILGSFNLNK